jgi:acyl-CoA synthetase (AMP-forming)/AMP-acid ligase II
MLVHNFLQNSAAKFGEKTVIVSAKSRLTYRELADQALLSASLLLNNGLKAGDRVAILTDNPFHYIASYFGVLQAGGVVVGLNTQTSERALDTVISDCQPAFLFFSGRSRKYRDFLRTFPSLLKSFDLDALSSDTDQNQNPSTLNQTTPQPDDIAQIIYTSGTTGKPKGVMLSHTNLVSNTLSTIEYLKLSENDSVMAVLPFFYSYGNSILLTHIAAGGTLVVNQSFVYPNVILEQMAAENITGLSGVPSTFALLLHRSAIRDYSFPHLRYITQAGAAMSPKLAAQLTEIFPGTEIFIMYGQTEAAPRLSYLAPEQVHTRPGSIGKAIPGVRLEIVDREGKTVSAGEIGEIVASGANIMKGYWQRPDETAVALRHGKLWTGDLAYFDEEGFLYVISRKSDMIKCGSHRIAPKEIEELLLAIDGIVEAAVAGEADEILGELIVAYIIAEPEKEIREKDVLTFCRKHLPAFKVPHKILFMQEFPKNESGKVQKHLLKT